MKNRLGGSLYVHVCTQVFSSPSTGRSLERKGEEISKEDGGGRRVRVNIFLSLHCKDTLFFCSLFPVPQEAPDF